MHRRAVVVAAVGLTAGCVDAVMPKSPQPREAERLAADGINDVRAEAGVERLPVAATLREAAREHARDMSERDFYDHVNPDGEAPEDRVACGAAENIHRGEIGPLETQDEETWYTREPAEMAGYLVRGWRLSEPHRQNMTQPDYRQLGVGIYVGSDNEFFASAMFC